LIKIGDKRYNPNEILSYEPYDSHEGSSYIEFSWINPGRMPTRVLFDSKEQRDICLNAMDEVFLQIKDGQIVKRDFPFPFMNDEPDEGLGGINLQ
jgi:hypothetical protein